MREFKPVLYLALIILIGLTSISNAQYWFQFGVRAGQSASDNNGASVWIQTITPQNNITIGSLGFWTGETLADGSFVQIGYVMENQTGNYPTYCNATGCSQNNLFNRGDAEWFYEYFTTSGPCENQFCGAIGSPGSVGRSGTYNNYSFFSVGNNWYFKVNDKIVGEVGLNTGRSGANLPVAFGEVANASTNTQNVSDVGFYNFTFYKSNQWMQVDKGFSYIGYGVGSQSALPNRYGVAEVGNLTNYFKVGSGINQLINNTELWNVGYSLTINSPYGKLNNTQMYNAYSSVFIDSPSTILLSSTSRAIFYKWIGTGGSGAYSGYSNYSTVLMNGNIKETVQWTTQYQLNISGNYSSDVKGQGWYDSGSNATYSVIAPVINLTNGQREIFTGWSNGNMNLSGNVVVEGPIDIHPIWKTEYYVNATSSFSKILGSGWYPKGSYAQLSVQNTTVYSGIGERHVFSNWSSGVDLSTQQVQVNGPIYETANFMQQYLVNLQAQNAYGKNIDINKFVIGNKTTNGTVFLDSGREYILNSAYYKGVEMITNIPIFANSTAIINVKMPVYNETIRTKDMLFQFPVNALVSVTFANTTEGRFYSGPNGTLTLYNIPYGYLNGTVELFASQRIYAQSGSNISVSVLSVADFVVILIVFMAILAYAARRLLRGKK